MYRPIAILVISFLLFGYEVEASSETNIPDDIEYNIIEDVKKLDIKRSVVVSLNRKVSKDVLKKIALTLKQNDTRFYQRTFIGYFLINPNSELEFWDAEGYFYTAKSLP